MKVNEMGIEIKKRSGKWLNVSVEMDYCTVKEVGKDFEGSRN